MFLGKKENLKQKIFDIKTKKKVDEKGIMTLKRTWFT